MKHYAMTVIFKDGTVDLCEVNHDKNIMRIIPTDGNTFINFDMMTACSSKEELIETMKACYENADYVTVKEEK